MQLEVADHFYHDAVDHRLRFRLTRDGFSTAKWRRVKCFTDLRMAYECALKSALAYSADPAVTPPDLIARIKGHGHRIRRLEHAAAAPLLEFIGSAERFGSTLDQLPPELRYRVESDSLASWNEQLYYDTIGSDSWLDRLDRATKAVIDSLDERLSRHSRLLSVEDLTEEEFQELIAGPNRNARGSRRSP